MSDENDDPNDEFEDRLRNVVRETAYSIEAFQFVMMGVMMPVGTDDSGPRDHCGGVEVCWRLHDLAMMEFGLEAKNQLGVWGIHSTEDFGEVVYLMVDVGLVAKTDDDSIADFAGVFDFENAFLKLLIPPERKPQFQWSLSTMLVATTLCAIAFAGVTQNGMRGAALALFSMWLVLIGGFCMVQAVKTQTQGWLVEFGIGALFLAGGFLGFLIAIH